MAVPIRLIFIPILNPMWACLDSNQGPRRYKLRALNRLSYTPITMPRERLRHFIPRTRRFAPTNPSVCAYPPTGLRLAEVALASRRSLWRSLGRPRRRGNKCFPDPLPKFSLPHIKINKVNCAAGETRTLTQKRR